MKSIIQRRKECYICGRERGLQLHHIFFGVANRKLSDEDGLVVYLCVDHHTGRYGPHQDREIDLHLKRIAERAWLAEHDNDVDAFIRRYGKNYL